MVDSVICACVAAIGRFRWRETRQQQLPANDVAPFIIRLRCSTIQSSEADFTNPELAATSQNPIARN
jgi:hypothetical protein